MKKLNFDPLKKDLAGSLLHALRDIYPNEVFADSLQNEFYDLFVIPPQKEMGHLAFGCFTLAKLFKKGPPQIAASLAEKLKQQTAVSDMAQKTETIMKQFSKPRSLEFTVQNLGPYVNFFFTGKTLVEKIINPIVKNSFFNQKFIEDPPRVMIEYSQPNTHKELHVGHMRNACLGDSLVRMHRYAHYPVVAVTFPGDMGTHVAKCLWYLKYHNQEAIPDINKGEWIGRIYSKAHLKLEDEAGSLQENKNREELTQILKQLEEKKGEYYELWKKTRLWSVELMNEVYSWINIKFDHWYWESEVDSDSVMWVKELFAEGKLVESQGAIGMDLSDKNLGFCVLLKTDGNGLYSTKDLELARKKFNDYKIEKNIYVVDTRQALHFQQVFAVLDRLGFSQAKNCFHLQYNFVELPDGAMSSRKGNIVPITVLINQMQEHVKTQYLARYQGDWAQTEVEDTAAIVAKGAIKYGMLKMDPNKKIIFDMNEWLKLDGDSGPYILYAYARIQSILRKFAFDESFKITGEKLVHPLELHLAVFLSQFNTLVISAIEHYRPSMVCNYLYDLSKLFSQFYAECSVGYAETPELQKERLYLSYATALVLKQGLELLGIPVPSRM
jgi:arginyl-tRNA synthetase